MSWQQDLNEAADVLHSRPELRGMAAQIRMHYSKLDVLRDIASWLHGYWDAVICYDGPEDVSRVCWRAYTKLKSGIDALDRELRRGDEHEHIDARD